MKYLLTPLTMLAWYLTAYYGLYLVFVGMIFLFSLSWFWLIIGSTFLIGLIFGITIALPHLLQLYILKLYDFNRISCIVHGLAGAFGTYQLISFLVSNPPMMVSDNQEMFFLTGMLDIAPLKTIFLVLPFFGLAVYLIWNTTILPFSLLGDKIDG